MATCHHVFAWVLGPVCDADKFLPSSLNRKMGVIIITNGIMKAHAPLVSRNTHQNLKKSRHKVICRVKTPPSQIAFLAVEIQRVALQSCFPDFSWLYNCVQYFVARMSSLYLNVQHFGATDLLFAPCVGSGSLNLSLLYHFCGILELELVTWLLLAASCGTWTLIIIGNQNGNQNGAQ